jgi:glyoxylate/hydroxypyruvate reductase A
MTTIALCVGLSAIQRARLENAVGNARLIDCLSDGCVADFSGCEIAFGNPPADWLETAQALRWVQLESVGFAEYANLDWSRLAPRLKLTNLAGFFADAVAETALAGILALGRGIDDLVQLRTRGDWIGDPLRQKLRLLRGETVVMVGFGAINRRLADLLAPFSCRIVPFRRGFVADDLDSALPSADIVVCTAPDTPETRGLFSAERLNLLAEGAIFVSLGRGTIVDEDALAARLTGSHLGGAVIDVTIDEPLPAGHALWTTPNTILSQHTGGGSADELDRKIDVFLENLFRYRNGETLVGLVEMNRGY